MTAVRNAIQQQNVQSKIVMIFILVLSLSGLENLIAEIIPSIEIGPIEVGISNFFFVPLVLVILFNNWWAALAAPIGEIIFSDLILGEFGGLGEFEEVILVTVALMVAAYLVKDPKNRMQVLIAGLVAYLVAEIPATFIDILKVWVGVEAFEAVEGLPQSIVAVESIDLVIEFIISGVIFGALPAMWLAPRLHGKIEPLMGIRPRTPGDRPVSTSMSLVIIGLLGVVASAIIAIVSANGFNLVEWEPEFLESIGEWFIYVAIAIAAVIAAAVIYVAATTRGKAAR